MLPRGRTGHQASAGHTSARSDRRRLGGEGHGLAEGGRVGRSRTGQRRHRLLHFLGDDLHLRCHRRRSRDAAPTQTAVVGNHGMAASGERRDGLADGGAGPSGARGTRTGDQGHRSPKVGTVNRELHRARGSLNGALRGGDGHGGREDHRAPVDRRVWRAGRRRGADDAGGRGRGRRRWAHYLIEGRGRRAARVVGIAAVRRRDVVVTLRQVRRLQRRGGARPNRLPSGWTRPSWVEHGVAPGQLKKLVTRTCSGCRFPRVPAVSGERH